MRLFALTVCVAFAAALPNFAAAADALAGHEIATHLIDRTFIYRGHENGRRKQGRIVYGHTGKLYIRTRQGYLDSGTWVISKDRMCTRVTLGRHGARRCFSVYPNSDGSYSTSHKYRLYPVTDRSYKGA